MGRVQIIGTGGYQPIDPIDNDQIAQHGKEFPDDASKVVVMLPDRDGSVSASFDVDDIDNAATAVLVDEGGKVTGTASGSGAGEHILQLLD